MQINKSSIIDTTIWNENLLHLKKFAKNYPNYSDLTSFYYMLLFPKSKDNINSYALAVCDEFGLNIDIKLRCISYMEDYEQLLIKEGINVWKHFHYSFHTIILTLLDLMQRNIRNNELTIKQRNRRQGFFNVKTVFFYDIILFSVNFVYTCFSFSK